ncbi:MAG TPA: hypothetical protein VHG28_16330 [Longimicrobiaceae bacterium]|nr:hypothetical protein [Longimicrobiaceae bacterium]
MTWIWILLTALTGVAGLRYAVRIRAARSSSGVPTVDDDALRRILEEGSLGMEEDEPLDLEEAARAEEEFWAESWDEPEEYPR